VINETFFELLDVVRHRRRQFSAWAVRGSRAIDRLVMNKSVTYDRPMPTLFTRILRGPLLAMVLMAIGTALVLGRDWLKAIYWPGIFAWHGVATFLAIVLVGYFVLLAVAAVGVVVLGWVIWRSLRTGRPRPGSRSRLIAARCLLFCASTVFGLVLAEAAAGAWLAWIHRLPALPSRFAESARPSDEIVIVVIGESSALGVPYEGWLSVGAIVGRELQNAIPAYRFRIKVLAEKGANLETMHLKLARLTERPDALIVYAGHNEFLARFSLSNRVSYYVDEPSWRRGRAWLDRAARFSHFCTLVLENLEKRRLSVIPARSLGTIENVVGRPVCTPEEASAVVSDFHRRLAAIIADCSRIGCLPILIIPPGNDASDPSQSYASRETGALARRTLFHRLTEIRSLEERDPDRALAAYRQVVADQPTLAHAHYRLARLLESAGSFAAANHHYILAREHDGLPLRCITALEAAYRSVARRHSGSVLLVDGPAVLRTISRHGILDGHLFHDNVHPTLVGHIAIAQAVLSGLKARGAFGWPATSPVPLLDPRQCADDFGIDSAAWATVCDREAAFYGQLAFLSVDPAERTNWRDLYAAAARKIRAGTRPEATCVPGIGIGIGAERADAARSRQYR
jgi:hypothetical protein